ncbi:MAG: ABC transporter substrate-binding protein [Chloroflexota bacterium]|nr:ABC transporter substrate-binding protein [Chloroflexota bacterium]
MPSSPDPSTPGETPTIRVGSAGFYESALMAEIYAQVLEANGFEVDRDALQTGPRDVTFPGLQNGDFDMMPEYIGSLLEFANENAGEASGDAAATAEALQAQLDELDLTALGYTAAIDTNAYVVRQDTADEYGLATMSDLADVQDELSWGLPPECVTNPLCGGALTDDYGIDLDAIDVTELGACDAPMAQALNEGGIDVAQLCSTQPDIERFGFVLLEDDQGTQPADAIAPVFRNEILEAAGGADALAALLDPVSDAMTTEDLTALNVRVGLDQEDFADVATDWLTENGLLTDG